MPRARGTSIRSTHLASGPGVIGALVSAHLAFGAPSPQLCPPSSSPCCDPSPDGTPGCSDIACCEMICAGDPFCCTVSWDSICAQQALLTCEPCGDPACPPSVHDCCGPSPDFTPGCSDSTCCQDVCNADFFCCSVAWDEICAEMAMSMCAACEGGCVASTNDCCEPSIDGTPYCADVTCCNAVCTVDPSCCETSWDADCALQASALCGICDAGCGTAMHSCWEVGPPGCVDPSCCEGTCAFDPGCCESGWDSWCVWAAMTICGPPPGTCGAAGHGPYTTGAPGCDDIACCESVCAGEPSCCTMSWDAGCVSIANAWCGPNLAVCGAATHDCLTQGGPGCDDQVCCELVCTIDPTCCSDGWDASCTSQALVACIEPLCEIAMPPGARLEQEVCGTDTNGGCTQAPMGDSSCCHGNCSSWYCDDFVCTNAVWAVDPFCVCICWDFLCAQEAVELCPDLCSAAPIAFESIACGDVIYGTLWETNATDESDDDWYELVLDAPALVEVTLTAGTMVEFGIAETDGLPDCGQAGELDPFATTVACEPATVSRCLDAGVHWIKLGPDSSSPTVTCSLWRSAYILSVSCRAGCVPADPPNDICGTAIPIVEGATEFDTSQAATEVSDGSGCFAPLQKDLWYTFDAPRSGMIRFSTCNATTMATRLVLLTGVCGGLATIACSDNDLDCPIGGHALEAQVEAGQQYHLRIGSTGSEQGAGTIFVAYLPCAAAYAVELAIPELTTNTAEARGINASGTICGRSGSKAITWNPTAGLVNISGTLTVAYATDLNDTAVVVGSMGPTSSSTPTPFIAIDSVATALAIPQPATSAFPLSINNAGTIVGEAMSKAVRWVAGVPEFLSLPLGPNSSGRGINQAGEICGFMGGGALTLGARHGFVLSGATVVDIVPPDGASSEANGLNDVGQVVGFLRLAAPGGTGTVTRAFVWSDGVYTVIEPWPGFSSSTAVAINDAGVVLGSMLGTWGSVAFVWYGGVAVPIGDLVAVAADQSITALSAISASGQIAGTLTENESSGSDRRSPLRLSPIPASGDLDCDGSVNAVDLALLLGAWGPCPAGSTCAADIDHDGIVDAADLAIVLGGWG